MAVTGVTNKVDRGTFPDLFNMILFLLILYVLHWILYSLHWDPFSCCSGVLGVRLVPSVCWCSVENRLRGES